MYRGENGSPHRVSRVQDRSPTFGIDRRDLGGHGWSPKVPRPVQLWVEVGVDVND